MSRAIAIAIAIAACGDVHLEPDIDTPPRHEPGLEPEFALDGIEIVLESYSADVEVAVFWSAERIPVGDKSYMGAHYGCGESWIVWVSGMKLWQTALAHELGHCVRTTRGLGTDPTHTDLDFWEGDVVEAIGALRQSQL